MKTPRYSLLISAVLVLGLPLIGLGQTTWDFGGTPDKNWSTFTNWSTNATPAATAVVFGATGTTASAATVGNIVDTDYTGANSLTSLTYNANSSNWQVTQIASGNTLTVGGNFLVGGYTTATMTQAAFTGSGTLAIDAASSTFRVANTGSSSLRATLDMSGLATFTANVSSFNVGNGATGFGTLLLAGNSTITAGTLNTGGSGSSYGASTISNRLQFGTTTVLNVDTITFGTGRTIGEVKFQTGLTGATLKIRAKDGVSRASLSVGDLTETGSASNTSTTTLDMTGGSVDALVGTLKIGRSPGALTSSYTASMSMAAGTFDATNVIVGETANNNTGAGTMTGTLNISGGSFTTGAMTLANNLNSGNRATKGNLNVSGTTTAVSVTGDLTMGVRTGATVTPTVTVSGGTLTVGGNLAEGSGTGASIVSTVNLSGGMLDMTHGNIAVDTFAFTGGTLKNVAALTGDLNAQGASTLAYDLDANFTSLSLTGALTLGASSNLSLTLANDFTPSASYMLVSNDLSDSISGTFLTINGGVFGGGNTFTLTNNTGTYNATLSYTGGDGNDLTLALVAIPEPSTYAMLAGVLALGAVVCRRRR